MCDYEADQGRQYQEGPVHVNEKLAGPILATVAGLQQSLREAQDKQQKARDHAVDADILRCQTETEISRL